MRPLRITHVAGRDTDTDKYLKHIGKSDLLSAEQEGELAKRIRNGDQEALEMLVTSNLRFVVSVAKQYNNQGLAISDLINEGNLGLIRAAYKFDETRGFKFISYAVWWIRQAMMQAIVEQSRIIRLPVAKIGAYTKISKAFAAFEQEYQREPDVEELMEMLGMTKEEIDEYFQISNLNVTTESRMNLGEGSQMSDIIHDEHQETAEDKVMKKTVQTQLNEALSKLSDREAEIIASYFGLNGEVPLTLEEIGQRYDLSRERVRQIKEKCIRQLKESTSPFLLQAYVK
ncbi:MAG: RNA polymerase sigma factor RpoD/SigA [Bacteroidetes bacterium]|nr:RNA polymerase sigma factor RpoD/SigA [Bacteroidota bacterium]